MARIASFTSSGVPTGPQMTLDALMARQRQLAARSNQITADRDMTSPWQGAAYLGDVIANKFEQGRADLAATAANRGYTEAMAGLSNDPTKFTSEQLANIGQYSPETMTQLWKMSADAVNAMRDRESFATLTPEEEAAAGLDPAGSYQRSSKTGKVDAIGGGGTNVTVSTAGDKKWNETGAAKFGERVDAYSGEGVAARQQLQNIDQLEFLMQDLPQGLDARMTQYLRDTWGINLGEGADKLTAFNTLVNKLVPSQRPPGSGPMSDRDVQLFKDSLPSYLNTPEGNRMIVATMRGIAEYNAALGAVADQALAMPDVNAARQFFTTEVNKLQDPLAAWRNAETQRVQSEAGGGAAPGAPAAAPAKPVELQPDDQAGFNALPEGQTYTVPGDPTVYVKQPKARPAVPNGG